ncbi:MAG: dihydroneopterin aldolase [Saprospiraceae bacterium]
MAQIALEGMRFHAFHGVHEAEQVLGSEFIVDVFVRAGILKGALADNLALTINYETIYQLCRLEMEQPKSLLEAVVMAIIERMKAQFADMHGLRVRVRKLNPPLGGQVAESWVEEELDFVKDCPRCTRNFVLYETGDCWNHFPNLHPATRESLLREYRGKCLCPECLKFYAG